MKRLDAFLLWVAAFCGGLLIGFAVGAGWVNKDMEMSAARRGFGAYMADPITGKVVFEWKESAK